MLKNSAVTARALTRLSRVDNVVPDRVFSRALHGYAARLTPAQRASIAADPDVAAVVPDEVVTIAGQLVPTGVSRIGGKTADIAAIDGVDERVDADVAIVDTGIDPTHPDLNVVGGYNCASSDPTAWADVHGHGTHVAGTVGAIDDGSGVVGVAPGVRLWAVRILDKTGKGLLSWYVCGLDWIAAQKDPDDPSRPLIEAVNMSVTKWGSDDGACGTKNHDILHAAICRVVDAGVTVVAAAANDSGPASKRVPASYDEVITVSALADTDGKPGGLGGRRCLSWGSYDRDDTFADFSNYGSDVDLIAPGKCIWSTLPGAKYGYLSGTSMAAPHVAGAVALYKEDRPWASPADVKDALVALAGYDWRTSTDPDHRPDPLLDVSKIGPYGDWSLEAPAQASVSTPAGTTARTPITIDRTPTFVERVRFSATASDPALTPSFAPSSLVGLTAHTTDMLVAVDPETKPGSYDVAITATEHGRSHATAVKITVLPTTRIAGKDRFATAAALSRVTFHPGVGTAYIASAYDYPDALAGAAAAGTRKGPVLLVGPTGPINPSTAAELTRLQPARIFVLGGPGVVSAGVANALAAFAPKVTRLAGPDRFATAAAVSRATFDSGVGNVYIASAYDFPDALAGAAAAAVRQGPVLLAAPTGPLAASTVAELKRLAPGRIVVLGGPGALSDPVVAALRTYAPTFSRLAGSDRFGTAAAVSKATFPSGVGTVYIASAYAFPDALAGAAAAGTKKGPVLLTAPTGPIDAATITELERLKPARIVVLGGPAAVSDPVLFAVAAYTGG